MQVQIMAERCWKVVTSEHMTPNEADLNPANTRVAQIDNRQLKQDYAADFEAYEQKVGMAVAIIPFSLTPATESFVIGMLDPIEMWVTLKEKISLQGNPALQQTTGSEFDAHTFNGKEGNHGLP